MQREFTNGRHSLKITENESAFAKHDLSMIEEARWMAEHWLDLYIGVNKDLTQELKVYCYLFARFLEGARMRPAMGEASMMEARFSMGK